MCPMSRVTTPGSLRAATGDTIGAVGCGVSGVECGVRNILGRERLAHTSDTRASCRLVHHAEGRIF